MLRSLTLGIICALVVSFSAQSQTGGSPPSQERTFEGLPRYLASRIEAYEADVAFNLGNASAAGQVIDVQRIWEPGSFPLRVCFFPNRSDVLLKIAKYASEWESADTGVRFDFGLYPALNRCDDRSGSYQIRIGFEPTGYWSLVGRDSVLIASQGEQSMNFGRWGAPSAGVSTREMRATVLHEFGHALGLRHAHQNAASTCEDDFAFDRIYPHLAGPPNFWNSKKVDYNLRSIRDRNVQSTKLDKNSIMKYYFPPEFYKTGKDSRCYSEENIELSDGDRATIAAIYPASAVSSIKVANARIESLVTALGDTETAATLRPNSILSRLLKGQQLKIPLNAMVPSDFYTGDRQAVRPGILPQSISRF